MEYAHDRRKKWMLPVHHWGEESFPRLVKFYLTTENLFFLGIAQFGATLNKWESTVNTFLEGDGEWGDRSELVHIGEYCRMGCGGAVWCTLNATNLSFEGWMRLLDLIVEELDKVTEYIIMGRSWWGNGPPLCY